MNIICFSGFFIIVVDVVLFEDILYSEFVKNVSISTVHYNHLIHTVYIFLYINLKVN